MITAFALLASSTGSGLAQEMNGPAMVSELCTKCHNLDEVVRLRQNRDEWTNTVYSMIARGAPIFPDEIEAIIDYLSSTYPTTSR